tara:strand:- start:16 stop:411 length:396 start_codon:yes stop_codon:yes gene_type:complete
MSYNQTYGKINKSETVEKRDPAKKATKQIVDAMSILNQSAKQLHKIGSDMRKATNLVEGARGHMSTMDVFYEIGPKPDKSKQREARRIMSMLKTASKKLLKLDESVMSFESRDYVIQLATIAAHIDNLERK